MHRNTPTIAAAAGLVAGALLAPAAQAGADTYRFDLVHTQVLFSLSHLGYSKQTGRLHVKGGWFRFDPDDWAQAQVDVEVDAASVDMGNAGWDDKLRSHEFFSVQRYPTTRFVATGLDKRGERDGVLHGKLTLLGATRPVDLAVHFNKAGVDPYTFKRTIGFSATTTLKRSAFGMSKYLPDIGDEVELRIEVEGLRDRDAQGQAAPAAATPPDDAPADHKEP